MQGASVPHMDVPMPRVQDAQERPHQSRKTAAWNAPYGGSRYRFMFYR